MIRYIALIAVLAAPVWSYSAGAPKEICENNLTPNHGFEPQASSPPYTISGSASVKSGELLELTLSGDNFLGFAVQARTSNNKAIGSFKPDGKFSQTISCSGIDNTLTHTKLKTPITSLKIQWHAPQSYQGPVTFYATVVKTGDTFWVDKIKKNVNVS